MLSSSGVTLSFDLSKKCTAWAIMDGPKLIEYGTVGWPVKTRTSELFLGLAYEFSTIVSNAAAGGIAIERIAFEYAAFQKGKAVEQFHALAMAVKVSAHQADIPCYMLPVGNVKRLMTGKGNAKKPEMIRAVNAMTGLRLDPEKETPDADIADAISIGYALYRGISSGTEDAFIAQLAP